jgi:hypothetical protein
VISGFRQLTDWRNLRETGLGIIASESTTNGEFALNGTTVMLSKWKLLITTK